MSTCKHGWADENYVKCPRCYDDAQHAAEVSRLTRALEEATKEMDENYRATVAVLAADLREEIGLKAAAEAALEEARALVEAMDRSERSGAIFSLLSALRAALAAVDAERREGGGHKEIESALHLGEAHGYDLGFRAGAEAAAKVCVDLSHDLPVPSAMWMSRAAGAILALAPPSRPETESAAREPWTDCNDRKCGTCAACRGLVRRGDYAAPPAETGEAALGTCESQTGKNPHTKCYECVDWKPLPAPAPSSEEKPRCGVCDAKFVWPGRDPRCPACGTGKRGTNG